MVAVDVGVHRDCVGGEESGAGWEFQFLQVGPEVVGGLEEGRLLLRYGLELEGDPNSERVEETAGA